VKTNRCRCQCACNVNNSVYTSFKHCITNSAQFSTIIQRSYWYRRHYCHDYIGQYCMSQCMSARYSLNCLYQIKVKI